MSKKITISISIASLVLLMFCFKFSSLIEINSLDAPYFILVEDYEPQRNLKYYIYDINHPKMQKPDGSIKTRKEFYREVLQQNGKECNFINLEDLGLVTPQELYYSKKNNSIYRDTDGNFFSRNQIIKNFEALLIEQGDISPNDTLVINKDSTYYYSLRKMYYDDRQIEKHTLNWGDLENNGTIPLEILKSNVVLPLEVYDSEGNAVKVHQATIGFSTWKQVCGKLAFEHNYAPLMKNGVLSKKAVQNIQKLNQSGECVLIENIIIYKDGKFVEIPDRFKFVVKNTVLNV